MKKILALLVVTIITSAAYAQKGHYFYASFGGGYHDYDFIPDEYFYKNMIGETWAGTPCMGITLNLGWQFFLTNCFGVGVGANICNYGESWHMESVINDRPIFFNDYTEPLRQTNLEIPISMLLQASLGRRLYLVIGLNGYPSTMLSQTWKMKKGSIDYQNRNYANLSGDTHFKKFEFGVGGDLQFCIAVDRYRTKEIIIGSYASYGLTDIKNQSTCDGFFDSNTLDYNGIANINVLGSDFSTHHRRVGLMLGFRYHLDLAAKKHKKNSNTKTTNNPKL